MENQHGDYIWYELLSSDADAAQAFYGKILDWRFADSGQPGVDYRIFSAGDEPIGGLLPITAEMQQDGAQPGWLGYIRVDDVDSAAAAIEQAGGRVHRAPWDIAEVGRLALVADPQGVMFYLMQPKPAKGCTDTSSRSFAALEPMLGHCAWNELATTDVESAKRFYAGQFGWVENGSMGMGPLGDYLFWKVGDARDFMLGAVMPKMAEMPAPGWSYYFRVADIDAAVAAILDGGGQLLQPPTEIPGGEFSLMAIDPQGAVFALIGQRVEPSDV